MRHLFSSSRAGLLAAASAALAGLAGGGAAGAGCGSNDVATPSGGAGGGAAASTSAATTGSGGSGGAATASVTSTSATTSSSSGGGSPPGTGGAGGESAAWPSCDAAPPDVPVKTLHAIWQDEPAEPSRVWVPGVYVTAISETQCHAGAGCQLFVQQAETFADLGAGAQQALKVFVSPSTAEHFAGIAVGDKVDLDAWAWRYTIGGQNELLLQVNTQYPGCMTKVGSGDPKPVAATLPALTLDAYEHTLGPLLVQVSGVAGKPHLPEETFALFEPGVFSDAGVDEVVSLSPYFLAGAVFTGLSPEVLTNFTSVTGVFGVYAPDADPLVKYKEIYPRTMGDVVIGAP